MFSIAVFDCHVAHTHHSKFQECLWDWFPYPLVWRCLWTYQAIASDKDQSCRHPRLTIRILHSWRFAASFAVVDLFLEKYLKHHQIPWSSSSLKETWGILMFRNDDFSVVFFVFKWTIQCPWDLWCSSRVFNRVFPAAKVIFFAVNIPWKLFPKLSQRPKPKHQFSRNFGSLALKMKGGEIISFGRSTSENDQYPLVI